VIPLNDALNAWTYFLPSVMRQDLDDFAYSFWITGTARNLKRLNWRKSFQWPKYFSNKMDMYQKYKITLGLFLTPFYYFQLQKYFKNRHNCFSFRIINLSTVHIMNALNKMWKERKYFCLRTNWMKKDFLCIGWIIYHIQ
jgi:hypothetical protein